MKELKTLKDIPFKYANRYAFVCEPMCENIRTNLRAEAIQWIKELNNGIMPKKIPMYIWKLQTTDKKKIKDTDHTDLIQWIITFFNITEEELK